MTAKAPIPQADMDRARRRPIGYAACLIVGFALGIYAVNMMSYGVYSKALLSLECRMEGKTGIWDWDIKERYCADLSDMYSAQEAFNRMIERIFAAHYRPH